MSVPTVAAPTRPYMVPPLRPPFAELTTSSSPRYHHFSHVNYVPQLPPAAYNSGIHNNSGNTAGNVGYSGSQQWLFPPPSLPETTISQGYQETHATHMQSLQHHQQPQGHNPYLNESWPQFKQETEQKHRKSKSKSKSAKPVTEKMVDSMATDLSSQASLGDIKQGKPAMRVGDTDRKQPVKGRGRTPRETLAVGHLSKQQHHHKS